MADFLRRLLFGGPQTLPQPPLTWLGAGSSPPLVLYTEEGGYFGQKPWPCAEHRGPSPATAGAEEFDCADRQGAILARVRKNLAPAEAARYYLTTATDHGGAVLAAHIRVLHSPDWQSAAAVRALRSDPRDVLVHYSMEPPFMWPADLDAGYMGLFDVRWGYHRRFSVLPSVYFPRAPVERLRRPVHSVAWAGKVRSRVLVTAVSNCEDYAGRATFLLALREAMGGTFVNFGKCHPSQARESEREISRSGVGRFIARGYFYLALENSNCDDYVTEKLGRALVSGVVPVVHDAPSAIRTATASAAEARADGAGTLATRAARTPGYARFLPPHTYVNAADFDSVDGLAAHLRAAATNRTLYRSYLWPRRAATQEIIAA